jgi:Fe-S oxidoreductase
MDVITPSRELLDFINEEGGGVLNLCYQCGTCSATCPWNQVRTFLVRKLMHQSQLGLVDFEDEDIWRCVGCQLCVDRCPREVKITDVIRALRRVVMEVGAGVVPHSLRITVKNLASLGNPLGEPREKRTDWSKELDVKNHAPGTEILYFPCCYQVYDPALRKIPVATVSILKKAEVDFGILGDNLVCCGESIRKAGAESLFQNLARTNIDAFREAGVKRIIVTSPHCYHTFKDEYPELGGSFEVVHITQYLVELIKQGRLNPSKKLNKKVTYHDSCCLGRYAQIYDEPRQVLESLPGLELVEMQDNREYALCCGGCAGRLWLETKKEERFSDLRLKQAIDTDADILAIACPYCMINFDDSVLSLCESLSLGKSEVIKVKDIVELVNEAI